MDGVCCEAHPDKSHVRYGIMKGKSMRMTIGMLCCLFWAAVLSGCGSVGTIGKIDQGLADELISMRDLDQSLQQMVVDGASGAREAEFFERKRRLLDEQGERCEAIFEQVGYPGADLVGKEASHAFWLLVQHADSDPEFQERVAEAMKLEVRDGNADGDDLAYLTDRVRVNTGRSQLYGTQVEYDLETGRAMPKRLEDPGGVDARRSSVGLKPLWEYMNSISNMHYQMNESRYSGMGIDNAWTYPTGFNDW